MKNKILASLTVLCAALVLVGGFSVTAYAQTPTEETDDSGVIVETEPQPLTPEGNMTLVDDIDGDAAEDKQFIVVKSKGGNYFYIIVDRAAEGGKFRPLPKSSRRKRPYGDYRGGTDRTTPGCLQLYREMQGGRSKHRLPRLLCQHG